MRACSVSFSTGIMDECLPKRGYRRLGSAEAPPKVASLIIKFLACFEPNFLIVQDMYSGDWLVICMNKRSHKGIPPLRRLSDSSRSASSAGGLLASHASLSVLASCWDIRPA